MTPKALQLVRDAGFRGCVSCCGGLNRVNVDPFQIKRVPIAEWFVTPDQFGFEYVTGRIEQAYERSSAWSYQGEKGSPLPGASK